MVRSRAALFIVVFAVLLCPFFAQAAAESVNRRDGFLMIWNSISRPAEKTSEKPYTDVKKGDTGYAEITYAKSRGILNDTVDRFRPTEPLSTGDALLIILRTRSVERLKDDGSNDFMALPDASDVPTLAKKYGIEYDSEAATISQADLLSLMRQVDSLLMAEHHEVSLYSEKFNGKGTSFGEKFDMNAPTAAHRSFPYNTLVRVTNVANGKSIVVRINDRGPFVQGRDMDLSLFSFTQIAERASGKIQATFERLGDVNLVRRCADDRTQVRITKDVRLEPGIPHSLALGGTLKLTSFQPFVLRDLVYPDGTHTGVQTWVTKGETYEFSPSVIGVYHFWMGTKNGQVRDMRMEVVDCGA